MKRIICLTGVMWLVCSPAFGQMELFGAEVAPRLN